MNGERVFIKVISNKCMISLDDLEKLGILKLIKTVMSHSFTDRNLTSFVTNANNSETVV